MRTITVTALAIALAAGAVSAKELKTCSANKSYCDSWAKKKGWTQPQCAAAFERCMSTGEWHTGGEFGRTVSNVERR